jgi:hypothetical protein
MIIITARRGKKEKASFHSKTSSKLSARPEN